MSGITRRGVLGTLGVSGGILLGSGELLAAALQPPLVLRDIDIDLAFLPAGELVDLERDLVRQWRDGLHHRIVQHSRAIAIVRWDKVMMLAGLGKEEGLSVTHAPLPLNSSLFRVELLCV
jgi:hypothetical protein